MLLKQFKHNKNVNISIVIARYYLSHDKLEKIFKKFIKILNNDAHFTVSNIKFIDLKLETSNIKTKLLFDWKDKEPDFFDFSAYEEIEKNSTIDLFLYLNDTMFIKHPWRVIRKKLKDLLPTISTIQNPAAIGIVYPYSEALIIDNKNPTLEHMTTFCFVLNKSANKIFHSKLESLPREQNLANNWIRKKVDRSLFIEYLLNIHIYGPDSPWKWKKSSYTFSEKTLTRKAISVILEYDLNSSILNSDGLIIPIVRDFKYLIFQKIQSFIGKLIYREYF